MREIKKKYADFELYERMHSSILNLYQQNCRNMRTFIDVDQIVKLNAINVALMNKNYWARHGVKLQIGPQPLEGLETLRNVELFENASLMSDFVGCLPSRDRWPENHLDIAFTTARRYNKPVEAHIDQCNIPTETESELFCKYVEKYNYQGKARMIHCVSLSCHSLEYQNEIAKRMKKNDIGVIICPSAAISMTQHSEFNAPIHNSLGPVEVLLKNGVSVGLGIDNIEDIFMPFCDGNFEFELRLLAEATRIYDPDLLLKIVNNKMGFK